MKLGLINSAWDQTGRGSAYGIRKTKEIGFDTIDITAVADPLVIDARERRLIRETCAGVELPIISVCCVAIGLTDFNPSVQSWHVDRAKRYLDMVREFGGRNLLLVLGEYVWQQQVIPPQAQWQMAVQNVRELGRHAAGLGLEIVMELEPFKLSLLNSVDTMLRFLKDVNLPKTVRANCDISHLHLVHTPFSEVKKLKRWIGHVHLSDCDGKIHGDLPPGRGVTPIKKYLAAILDTGFNGVVSIELEFSPRPEKIVEWVTEAYRETDKIMQALNCRK